MCQTKKMKIQLFECACKAIVCITDRR